MTRFASHTRTHAPPPEALAPDCRHYRGDKPCHRNQLCAGCTSYEPFAARVLVIKLGALGDVVRTLCLLPEIHRQLPGAQVTWVSLDNGCRMIREHPLIHRTLEFNMATAMVLQQERFDLLVSLDKEAAPCALANAVLARRKLGFGLSDFGTPIPLNPEARAFFHLGLSDELKFHRNTKSYPRLIHEAMGWPYRGQRYELPVDAQLRDRVSVRLAERGWSPAAVTLGVNVGAGRVFANKMWPASKTAALIARVLREQREVQVLLLGGPGERPAMDEILERVTGEARPRVIDPGSEFDEPTFTALVDHCEAVFAGDTMAMHVAVALGKRVVALFGPTCEQEIDLFGRGEKLVAKVACGPCYKRQCDHGDVCVDGVSTDTAAEAIGRAVRAITGVAISLPVLPQALRKAG